MRAVVSVLGRDRKGIIAEVSGLLYKLNINIEDISQTIIQGYFTMIMMTNIEDSPHAIEEINTKLKALAVELGVDIGIQSEDIFNSMHKI